jgi:Flp pilus assembly protein TadD
MSPTVLQIAVGLAARRPGLTALVLSLVLSACSNSAITPAAAPLVMTEPAVAESRQRPTVDAAPYAAAHKANPADPAAALAYAGALRANGAKREALAVLDKAAAARPSDRRLHLEQGLLALDIGEPARAEALLRQAHDPKAPDWRLHSALGAALASRGRQQEAQAQFAKALALAPDHPSVLNNLALSYVLDGKGAEAERLLRRAQRTAGAPQVRQNLALVLGLNGKYEEARTLGETALPAARAGENVAYLQRLATGRQDTSQAESEPPRDSAARKVNASLPQPSYQLGGPAN